MPIFRAQNESPILGLFLGPVVADPAVFLCSLCAILGVCQLSQTATVVTGMQVLRLCL